MANKLYEENDVRAIANAIRAKNGSSSTYKISQMAEAINNLPSGTTISNGTIEEFYVAEGSSSVTKNNFIQFNYTSQLYTTDNTGGSDYGFDSIVLDDNIFLVSHFRYVTSPSNAANLYLTVETLNNHKYIHGTTVTVLLGQTIPSKSYEEISHKLIKISSTKAILIVRYKTDIYGYEITISGTTITVGQQNLILNTGSNSSDTFWVCEIDTHKLLILYSKNSTSYQYGVIVTYDETLGSFTIGEEKQITTVSGTRMNGKAYAVDIDKAIVLHYGNNGNLYGTGISVSGTTITAGNQVLINNIQRAAYYYSAVKKETNMLLLASCSQNNPETSKHVLTIIKLESDLSLTVYGSSNSNYMIGFYKSCFCNVNSDLITSDKDFFIYVGQSFVGDIINISLIRCVKENTSTKDIVARFLIPINNDSGQKYTFLPVCIDNNKVIIITDYSNNFYKGLGIIEIDIAPYANTFKIGPYEMVKQISSSSGVPVKLDGFALENISDSVPGQVCVYKFHF